MPANPNRKVVDRKTVGFIEITIYDTGIVHYIWKKRNTILFSIPHGIRLKESTIVSIAEILNNPETAYVQSHYRMGIKLTHETSSWRAKLIDFIIESNLTAAAKLIYIIALQNTPINLTEEILEEIFQKTPHPEDSLRKYVERYKEKRATDFIQNALYTNFVRPVKHSQKTLEEYKRVSLLTAFLTVSEPITYGDFMEKFKNEHYFFREGNWLFDDTIYRPINFEFVKDLYPAEYVKYVLYFGSEVPSELRRWSLERFNSGIEILAETMHHTSIRPDFLKKFTSWDYAYRHLTLEEAEKFNKFIEGENGLSSHFSGVDRKMGALVAYYFVVGGAEKLTELALHVQQNSIDELEGARFQLYRPQLALIWRNPFSKDNRKVPRLLPYVQAIRDPELRVLPLEWALATL